MADSVKLSGLIEGDETFFSISYKGNHKKSDKFVMPRPAHKRGKQVHYRGLSHEKVCVPFKIIWGPIKVPIPLEIYKIKEVLRFL